MRASCGGHFIVQLYLYRCWIKAIHFEAYRTYLSKSGMILYGAFVAFDRASSKITLGVSELAQVRAVSNFLFVAKGFVSHLPLHWYPSFSPNINGRCVGTCSPLLDDDVAFSQVWDRNPQPSLRNATPCQLNPIRRFVQNISLRRHDRTIGTPPPLSHGFQLAGIET